MLTGIGGLAREGAGRIVARLDHALPPALALESEIVRGQARALVANTMVGLFAVTTIGAVSLSQPASAIRGVCLLTGAYFAGVLLQLRITGNVERGVHLFLIGTTMAYLSALSLSGGLASPLVTWIPVYPVLIVSVRGLRAAGWAIALSLLSVVLWGAAHAVGMYDDFEVDPVWAAERAAKQAAASAELRRAIDLFARPQLECLVRLHGR